MRKSIFGDIGLLVVTIVWGLGFVGTDIALETATTLQITALRFIVATILLSLIFFKQLKKINKDILLRGCVLGFLLFIAFYFQTEGMKYTTPSKNAFITTTNIIFVPFLSFVLLKTKIDKYSIIGAGLSFIGITFLTINDKLTGFNYGDFLTLICAVMFAMQIIYTGLFAKSTEEPILLAIVQLAVTAILSTLAYLIFDNAPISNISTKSMMGILYLGVFSTAVGFVMQTFFQVLTTETRAAILLSFESVFGSIASVIILGEVLSQKMLLGAIIMFLAVLVAQIPDLGLKPINIKAVLGIQKKQTDNE